MTVSLFNHLCCFTLRTDGFGNLPSGGRTKTRKTIQAGRFQNEKRIKKQILTHEITMWRCMYQRPTDERIRVCAILELHSSSRRGRSGFGGFGVMSAVPPPFWRKSVTGQPCCFGQLISRFGRIASVSCFHSHFSFQRVAAFATIQISCLATACQLRYCVASVGKFWLCMQSCHGLR